MIQTESVANRSTEKSGEQPSAWFVFVLGGYFVGFVICFAGAASKWIVDLMAASLLGALVTVFVARALIRSGDRTDEKSAKDSA